MGAMSEAEARRLRWRIFALEHELEIGGHNDGYSCMLCWRLERGGATWRDGRTVGGPTAGKAASVAD